jgi:hypothetical protein
MQPELRWQANRNHRQPTITDEELVTIYLFGHLNEHFEKRAVYRFIVNYWAAWFPTLPSYQAFARRLNLLVPTFGALCVDCLTSLEATQRAEADHLIDSLPVILANGSRSPKAKVAREVANQGYCAAKRLYFHGLRLHLIARRRVGALPVPRHLWLREAACHDLRAAREQDLSGVRGATLIGDKAYLDRDFTQRLSEQATPLVTPLKKPKGKELSAREKTVARAVSRLRQPIESFFKWLNDKTGIQRASSVRSTEGLYLHCIGKVAFALFLLVS